MTQEGSQSARLEERVQAQRGALQANPQSYLTLKCDGE